MAKSLYCTIIRKIWRTMATLEGYSLNKNYKFLKKYHCGRDLNTRQLPGLGITRSIWVSKKARPKQNLVGNQKVFRLIYSSLVLYRGLQCNKVPMGETRRQIHTGTRIHGVHRIYQLLNRSWICRPNIYLVKQKASTISDPGKIRQGFCRLLLETQIH